MPDNCQKARHIVPKGARARSLLAGDAGSRFTLARSFEPPRNYQEQFAVSACDNITVRDCVKERSEVRLRRK